MKGVFVTGTDTGVGKTLLAACLLAAFPRARYAKPVQTGWPADDDAATVARLAGAGPDRVLAGRRLKEPCSPHHAAALERVRLSARDLVQPIRAADDGRPWVVEGAGGLLTPLSERETMLDLARAVGLPVLVAVAVRLGAINATLLTLRELERSALPVLGVVAFGAADTSFQTGVGAHAPGVILAAVQTLIDPVTPDDVRATGFALQTSRPLAEALA